MLFEFKNMSSESLVPATLDCQIRCIAIASCNLLSRVPFYNIEITLASLIIVMEYSFYSFKEFGSIISLSRS